MARHLVMTGRLIDVEPEQALTHARAAAALAGRVGVAREAAGLAAYAAGEWAESISELRTARRINGSAEHLAVIADCERALGRPERALELLDDPAVATLEQAARVELVIVVAGARRDRGEVGAAILLLQGPAKATSRARPWAARLWYAYADALLSAERPEARDWFAAVAEIDTDGTTDAVDRLLELDGIVLSDPDDDGDGVYLQASELIPDAPAHRPTAETSAEELQALAADVLTAGVAADPVPATAGDQPAAEVDPRPAEIEPEPSGVVALFSDAGAGVDLPIEPPPLAAQQELFSVGELGATVDE